MTWSCYSNPDHYERNLRFIHLVHALGRATSGAKLPSAGLCLNASKAESRLVTATIPLDVFFCLGNDSCFMQLHPIQGALVGAASVPSISWTLTWQSGCPKSSVDDLCTGRGVVLSRAAITPRSIETQPLWLDDLSLSAWTSRQWFFSKLKNCPWGWTFWQRSKNCPQRWIINKSLTRKKNAEELS